MKLLSIVKIYIITLFFILLTTFIYSYLLINNKITESIIIELIIGFLTFLLLTTMYSNHIHKKGLLVGMLTGLIHYLLIKLIFFLSNGTFNFNIIYFLIILTSSTLGGILGLLFKKII